MASGSSVSVNERTVQAASAGAGEQRIQHEGGSSVRSDDQPEEALARLDERSGEIVDGTGIAYEHLLETSVREVAPHGFDALFVHGVAPYVVADKVGRVCLAAMIAHRSRYARRIFPRMRGYSGGLVRAGAFSV